MQLELQPRFLSNVAGGVGIGAYHPQTVREALTLRVSPAACVDPSRSAALRGVCWLLLPGAGLASGADVLGGGGRRTPAITPMNNVPMVKMPITLLRFGIFNFWKGGGARDSAHLSAYFVADSPVATVHSPVLLVGGASIPAPMPKDVHIGDGIPGLRMRRFPKPAGAPAAFSNRAHRRPGQLWRPASKGSADRWSQRRHARRLQSYRTRAEGHGCSPIPEERGPRRGRPSGLTLSHMNDPENASVMERCSSPTCPSTWRWSPPRSCSTTTRRPPWLRRRSSLPLVHLAAHAPWSSRSSPRGSPRRKCSVPTRCPPREPASMGSVDPRRAVSRSTMDTTGTLDYSREATKSMIETTDTLDYSGGVTRFTSGATDTLDYSGEVTKPTIEMTGAQPRLLPASSCRALSSTESDLGEESPQRSVDPGDPEVSASPPSRPSPRRLVGARPTRRLSTSTVRLGPREMARYGLRARRIGEAARPGPDHSSVVFRRTREEIARGHHPLPAPENIPVMQPVHAARRAAQVVLDLARSCLGHQAEDVPQPLLRQKWSDLNVPLIKAAASNSQSHAILDWLESAGATPQPVQTNVGIFANVGVREAWAVLRERLRAWGINCIADLAHWLRSQGFRASLPLQYFGKRAQEFILDRAVDEDVRVCGLEMGYARATAALMTRPGLVREALANLEMRQSPDSAAPAVTSMSNRDATVPDIQTESRQLPAAASPSSDWVRIGDLADLERVLAARGASRPHEPPQAAAEMLEAGVGGQPSIAGHGAADTGRAPQSTHEAPRRERRGATSGATICALSEAFAGTNVRSGRSQPAQLPANDRLPAEPPPGAWEFLDGVNLLELFRRRWRVLKSCPRFMRGRYRHAMRISLEAIDAAARAGDALAEERSWKLFGLLSILLLHRPNARGSVGRSELEQRCITFSRGDWDILLASANVPHSATAAPERPPDAEKRWRQNAACARVRLEELSKARQALTSGALAPGTDATLQELLSRPRELVTEIPDEVLAFEPDVPLDFAFKLFARALKAAPRGSSGGPGETTNELLKVALDDEDTATLLHGAALRLARAQIPTTIADAFMSARMTALLKNNGRVRGIATGTAFRRLVAGCVARTIGPSVEDACKPYQYALSTRAGTECVGHLFRAATDMDGDLCVLSIDGVGAFDHVSRASMLSKLASLPQARAALPFVRLSYESPTEYVWTSATGQQHIVPQGEGGEQGDPLMPLLFALGIHNALEEVAASLLPGEDLAAFLDDVYVLCRPERVRVVYNALEEASHRVAGIALHTGKTRIWNRNQNPPPDIGDLGGDTGAWSAEGVVLLGVPVGTEEFVRGHAQERLDEEKRLLNEVRDLPDPQCSWQILSRCAVPRGNYWIRTLPPSLSQEYAVQRDDAIWQTFVEIAQAGAIPEPLRMSGRRIAQLPARLGGLGLRSTARAAPAAFWASWADALEMIQARNPNVAARILERLEGGTTPADGCLHELASCAQLLREEGFDSIPSWEALRSGIRPPPLPQTQDPVDRTPGWQFFASSTREKTERTNLLLSMCRSARALLRSQSGPGASAALEAAPTSKECTLTPERFQAWVRRRLRWPLPLSDFRCACGSRIDEFGDHHSACSRSGRLKSRAPALERTVAQICREAGARVQMHVKIRDLNIAARADDERQIEVIASGLPIFGGSQLAVDVTLRSVLRGDGSSRSQAYWKDGAVAHAARHDKEAQYPELASSDRCRFIVLALETGGRFSAETVDFLRQLAEAKALSVPSYLRASAAIAFQRRWTRMLAVSAASSYVDSLLLSKESLVVGSQGPGREPWLQDLLTESRGDHFWAADALGLSRSAAGLSP